MADTATQPDPQPHPAPEQPRGADILDRVRAALTAYVIIGGGDPAYDAVTLWIAATHGQPAWEHAPRLSALSPERQCGKSRLMTVVEGMSYKTLLTGGNISTAALVHSIDEKDPPTIFLDEADGIFGTKRAAENNEDVRCIVNSGHERDRPYVRWDMTARRLDNCPTFAMVMLAGIGTLPDTILDRSVIIQMRRRAADEPIRPYRKRRDKPVLDRLRAELHAWVGEHLSHLRSYVPKMPVEDRAADTWEPLIAIADAAGGDWPDRARAACTTMTEQAQSGELSLNLRLLNDLRAVFEHHEKLWTSEIIERLTKIEEAPWGDLYGRAVTPRDLSKRLRPYEVAPRDVKIAGTTRMGYYAVDLSDAWRRYLTDNPEQPQSDTDAAGDTEGPSAPAEAALFDIAAAEAEIAESTTDYYWGEHGYPDDPEDPEEPWVD